MLNLDNIVSNKNQNKDTTGSSSSERNNWPFRMLFIGPSGSGKTNTLLHLINNLHPIDKIYLYAKDINEPKYEYLINKREQAGIKNLKDPHAFIEYSDDIDDVLDDTNNYNKNRDKKVLIVFDDTITDIEYNKKFKRIIKELFYRARKIHVSIVFITKSYFRAFKDARLTSTHYILMKKGYIFEVDVRYPTRLRDLHSDLPFLPERMKVNKCKKLVCNLFNKKNDVVHVNSLKQALNHGVKLKKIHRIIEFNKK